MIIDTHTKNSIENSLAEYLNITIDELNKYINMVNNKSRDGIHFDGTIFEEEVSKIIDDLKPQRKIDDLGADIISLQGVLTDKKTRGTFGEVNLEYILNNAFGSNHQ